MHAYMRTRIKQVGGARMIVRVVRNAWELYTPITLLDQVHVHLICVGYTALTMSCKLSHCMQEINCMLQGVCTFNSAQYSLCGYKIIQS